MLKTGIMIATGFGAATCLILGATSAESQTILKFNSPAPPPSYLHKGVFEPWAQAIEKDAGGSIKIQMSYGGQLGNVAVAYDRLIDGVSDFAFILTGITGGRFKQQDVAALPFETRNSLEAALGLWGAYEKGVTADEYKQVKLLATWAFPNAAIHSQKPVNTIADLKGARLAINNAIIGGVAIALGASPVTLRPDDVYQALSRGTVDASIMPFTGMYTYKIYEVSKSHLDAPLGADAAAVIMNKQKFESLTAQARAAIEKHSGREFSRTLGIATQTQWQIGHNTVKERLTSLSPDEEARWKSAMTPITQKWAETTPDGQKVLETFRAEVRAVRTAKP